MFITDRYTDTVFNGRMSIHACVMLWYCLESNELETQFNVFNVDCTATTLKQYTCRTAVNNNTRTGSNKNVKFLS